MKGFRNISSFDLENELGRIEIFGGRVPVLSRSIFMPQYVETKSDGTEIYRLGSRTVEVRRCEFIDDHGNVVDLAALRSQPIVMHCPQQSIRIEREDRYEINVLTNN